MSSGGGHAITGGNDFVGRVPRGGHAGGKEGGSVSQASFGRFIASASPACRFWKNSGRRGQLSGPVTRQRARCFRFSWPARPF